MQSFDACVLTPRFAGMLFEWLYPSHFPTMLACLEAWAGARSKGARQCCQGPCACRHCLLLRSLPPPSPPPPHTHTHTHTHHHPPTTWQRALLRPASSSADTPEVTTALLKFMAEFVLNKTQRLTFDSSSPNGILLFREVSKVGLLLLVMVVVVVVVPPPPPPPPPPLLPLLLSAPPAAPAGDGAAIMPPPLLFLSRRLHLPACLQVIVTYGNRALQLGPTSDPYGQASGRWVLVECRQAGVHQMWRLPRCLAGSYTSRRERAAPGWLWRFPAAHQAKVLIKLLFRLPPLLPHHQQKYKGIWNCLAILTRALGGNYVNFGVFELYGDPALKVTTKRSSVQGFVGGSLQQGPAAGARPDACSWPGSAQARLPTCPSLMFPPLVCCKYVLLGPDYVLHCRMHWTWH